MGNITLCDMTTAIILKQQPGVAREWIVLKTRPTFSSHRSQKMTLKKVFCVDEMKKIAKPIYLSAWRDRVNPLNRSTSVP